MIAPNKAPKTFRMKVRRQDGRDAQPYWQEFDVDYRPNMNVISALQWIAAHPRTADGTQTTPVVWDCCCLEEVCGACTMVINGKVRQACSALIDELLEDGSTITLHPMTKFPVERDLFPDRRRLFEDLKRIKGWVPIDGLNNLGPGPSEPPDNQEMRYAMSRCMSCGCCLEVCPQYTRTNHFLGPAIIGQVRYFNAHEIGAQLKDERLEDMAGPGGVVDCGNAQNCVKACPKEVPLTEAIADVGRQVTVKKIKQFFTGK